MQTVFKKVIFSLIIIAFAIPSGVFGASLPISAWIPYWRDEQGIAEISNYLKPLWQANPFSYEVQSDGTLVDLVGLEEILWQDFWIDARAEKVKMVPTIAWHNGEEIMATLSDTKLRTEHVSGILAHVDAFKYDGVDINYENKPAESRPYFSAFLKELSAGMKKRKKLLSCTIEPRTPLASRFLVVPKDQEYANDYKEINKYCDEVKIMAYDQRNVDILLNAKKGASGPYLPVADKDWVEKVIKETTKTISAKKIYLGVPTFGYEYEIITTTSTNSTSTTKEYRRIKSLTYKDFQIITSNLDQKPTRNSAGEISAVYPVGSSTYIAWMSDAEAIKQKVALVKKYKLKGVSLFSVNGEGDPGIWKILK